MVGPSGSGKSTVVDLITRPYAWVNRPKLTIFSLDQVRLDLWDQQHGCPKRAYAEAFKFANDNPQLFSEYVTKRWNQAITENDVVIVDNTNLTRKSRARWVNDLRAKKFTITGVEVLAPLAVVIARQASRADKSVPEEAVRAMYMRQEGLMFGTECDELIVVDGTVDNSNLNFTSDLYA
jgi:predicted kinase